MYKIQTFIAMISLVAVCSVQSETTAIDIKDIQGGWWTNCQDPAVEFYIYGSSYSGDFSGSHKIEVNNNVLTFKSGLVDGHDIHVSGRPLSFYIVKVTKKLLVLKPVQDNETAATWKLYSCL